MLKRIKKMTTWTLLGSLGLSLIGSLNSQAAYIKKLELSEADNYLMPTQYGRGGANVKDMLGRKIAEWYEKAPYSQKCIGRNSVQVDLTEILRHISRGKKSFLEYISDDLSIEKNNIPAWAVMIDDEEKALQTDGHHRTSAFMGELYSILNKNNVDDIYNYFRNILTSVECNVVENDPSHRLNLSMIKYDKYQVPLVLSLSIKNKDSENSQAPSLRDVIIQMVQNGKILPEPQRMSEWNKIRQDLNNYWMGYLYDEDLAEKLWGHNGLLPQKFSDLKDDPFRSFMGNFMFFAKLDSAQLVDYIEFREGVQGKLFGGMLKEKCWGNSMRIADQSNSSGWKTQYIPVIDSSNWNNKDIKAAMMACVFDPHQRPGNELVEWLKNKAVRSEEVRENATRMITLAQLIWLLDDKNYVNGDRESAICQVLIESPQYFYIGHNAYWELKNPEKCSALVQAIKNDDHQEHVMKLIENYKKNIEEVIKNNHGQNTGDKVKSDFELNKDIESIRVHISHVIELMDKQHKRDYRKYRLERLQNFINENLSNSFDLESLFSIEVVEDHAQGQILVRDFYTKDSFYLNSNDPRIIYNRNLKVLSSKYEILIKELEDEKGQIFESISQEPFDGSRFHNLKSVDSQRKAEEDHVRRTNSYKNIPYFY